MMHRSRGSKSGITPATLMVTVICCMVSTFAIKVALFPTGSAAPLVDAEVAAAKTHHDTTAKDHDSSTVFRSEEAVLAHRRYKPLYRNWATKIFPLPKELQTEDDDGSVVDCVAWRQTGKCNPDGPREAFFDKRCEATIFSGPSGYCDCGNGVRKSPVDCGRHAPFTCADVCTGKAPSTRNGAVGFDDDLGFNTGGGVGDADTADEDDHKQDSIVIVNGETYPADKFLAARKVHFEGLPQAHKATAAIRDVFTSYVALKKGSTALGGDGGDLRGGGGNGGGPSVPLWQRALDVIRGIAALDSFRLMNTAAFKDKDADSSGNKKPTCISWRQTAGCNPHGKSEASLDRPCNALIADGMSGYCECDGQRRAPGVTCKHKPFTCNQLCDPSTAFDVHRADEESKAPHTTRFTDDKLYYRTLRKEEVELEKRGGQWGQRHLAAIAEMKARRASSSTGDDAFVGMMKQRAADDNDGQYARLLADVLQPEGVTGMDEYVRDMIANHVVEPTPKPRKNKKHAHNHHQKHHNNDRWSSKHWDKIAKAGGDGGGPDDGGGADADDDLGRMVSEADQLAEDANKMLVAAGGRINGGGGGDAAGGGGDEQQKLLPKPNEDSGDVLLGDSGGEGKPMGGGGGGDGDNSLQQAAVDDNSVDEAVQ